VSPRNPGTPQVSVITPLFNCLSRTQAMVESLQATMPRRIPYEIILVDDGSTDGTRQWLAGLGEPFRVVLNERNLGFGGATNRGVAIARGRFLALLNNDLVLRRGWFRPMLRTLRSLGGRAGVVGNVQLDAASGEVDHAGIFINLKGKPEHHRRAPGIAASLLFPIRHVCAVTGACILIRRETWDALGGLDESYVNGCEDVDLCLRARAAGLVNAVSLRSRVLHHVSSSPGRKLRDEENTKRLVTSWRREIAELGSREWTKTLFCPVVRDPRDFPDAPEAWRLAFYLAHVRSTPPPSALAIANVAIEGELARWSNMPSG
jgi:GT2 family glycosyltransferase